MTDHNILNRASFDDMQKNFTLSCPPFIREGTGVLELGGMNNVFWVKKISWEFKYIDVGVPGARRTEVQPIEVSVADVLKGVKRALPPFTEPKPIVGRIPFSVINTNLANNHRLDVDYYLDGVLVTPKAGSEPLTLKQMKAYIMMDSSARGQLALDEAAVDQLEEAFVSLGIGSLRDMIPGGMAALKTLPAPLQTAVIQGLVAKGTLPSFLAPSVQAIGMNSNQVQPPLALPVDPNKEQSVFIGDVVGAWPDDCKENLSKEQLQKVATIMIEKGWRRV